MDSRAILLVAALALCVQAAVNVQVAQFAISGSYLSLDVNGVEAVPVIYYGYFGTPINLPYTNGEFNFTFMSYTLFNENPTVVFEKTIQLTDGANYTVLLTGSTLQANEYPLDVVALEVGSSAPNGYSNYRTINLGANIGAVDVYVGGVRVGHKLSYGEWSSYSTELLQCGTSSCYVDAIVTAVDSKEPLGYGFITSYSSETYTIVFYGNNAIAGYTVGLVAETKLVYPDLTLITFVNMLPNVNVDLYLNGTLYWSNQAFGSVGSPAYFTHPITSYMPYILKNHATGQTLANGYVYAYYAMTNYTIVANLGYNNVYQVTTYAPNMDPAPGVALVRFVNCFNITVNLEINKKPLFQLAPASYELYLPAYPGKLEVGVTSVSGASIIKDDFLQFESDSMQTYYMGGVTNGKGNNAAQFVYVNDA